MISGILEQSLRDVPRTNWGAMYCDTRLSVCLLAHLRNRTNKFRKIFWTTVCGSGLFMVMAASEYVIHMHLGSSEQRQVCRYHCSSSCSMQAEATVVHLLKVTHQGQQGI